VQMYVDKKLVGSSIGTDPDTGAAYVGQLKSCYNNGNWLTLGALAYNDSTQLFTGDIAEALFVNQELSASDAGFLADYLNYKYNSTPF